MVSKEDGQYVVKNAGWNADIPATMPPGNVNVTAKNAAILAPILTRREEDKKYDLKEYMHKNLRRGQ